jgi:hypothetical protein
MMTFPIPDKINPVCEECKSLSPDKHEKCQSPCLTLVSWSAALDADELGLINQHNQLAGSTN